MTNAVEIENLSKDYGKLHALNNIMLNVPEGTIYGLVGPNGSGKTTLIKVLVGAVKPTAGSVKVHALDPLRNKWKLRRQIGYMPQIGRYPENMTVAHVINMMKDIRKDSNRKHDEDLVNSYGLKDIMYKRMRTLSGGTTQKVSASLAFLFSPDVLILDEPTAGLDPLASELLKKKIIEEKQNGKLILITSHVLSELDDLITEVFYMQEGKLLFHKKLSVLKEETGEEKLSKAIAKVISAQAE